MSQTERILFIDRKLRSSGYFKVEDVVKEFEVCSRQVKRDIEYMRNRFDAPIEWISSEKHYIYNEKFNRLEFADQHLILAYLSIQSMLKNANYFPTVSEEFLASFENQIPKDYKTIKDKIDYHSPQTTVLQPEVFYKICSSLRNKKCLQIKYTNSKNEETQRIVEPYNLINYGGNWYMICFDHFRGELRTFNIARVKKIELLQTDFIEHEKDFDKQIENFKNSGFGIFLGNSTTPVKIKFTGKAAFIVKDQIWHPAQKIEIFNINESNEYVEMTFPAANMTEVLSKILSFGHESIPLEPASLVDLWKSEIQKMNELFNC